MQCYEFQLMLNFIDIIVISMDAEYKYHRSDLLSHEILDQTRAGNLEELMNLDKEAILQVARPYVSQLHNIA